MPERKKKLTRDYARERGKKRAGEENAIMVKKR